MVKINEQFNRLYSGLTYFSIDICISCILKRYLVREDSEEKFALANLKRIREIN
tara:strand:- start:77 stop:238 length:162 start_codon:yes stop_codon:yes gene_type:complete